MEDAGSAKPVSFLLPVGCRFYPTEEQLLCYFLPSKNGHVSGDGNLDNLKGYDLIKELNLSDYDPFELPDSACFAYGYGGGKRHWYCYTVRVLKESSGREKRVTKAGYWKRRGKVRDVMGPGGKLVVGTRTRFVFYMGETRKSALRTDWVMYEYALLDHLKASFVLCRVFVKPRAGNCISENLLSCCTEENVSVVRHVGVQYNGPDVDEAKACQDNSIDWKSDTSRYPVRLVMKLDDHVTSSSVPIANSQFPAGVPQNDPVKTSELTESGMFADAGTLLSILEEDFIELDDLVE